MVPLSLEALQVFVRSAELRSFSKAAVALGLSQPSVSRPIADLESRLGGPLFYRTGRGVALTELGEILLPRARALLESAEQLSTDALAFGKSPAGNVSVAALPSTMQTLAPALYGYIRAHAPGIRLRIVEGFSDQVERWVSEGSVDIGLLSKYRALRMGQTDALFRARLVVIRANDRTPTPDCLPFRSLEGEPLVLPSHPNGLRVLLEETARKQNVHLNVVIEADSLVAQREIVRRCGCCSVVATHALEEISRDGALVGSFITEPELLRFIVLVTTQQRPLSRAARVILQAIRTSYGSAEGISSLSELATTLQSAKPELAATPRPPRAPARS
jgi:DNA-binding transcriptional LysR family regulator